MICAHWLNHNQHSIEINYEGGHDANGKLADTRTETQKESMLNLLTELKKQHPNALMVGHSTFSNKACPCFDAAKEYQDM